MIKLNILYISALPKTKSGGPRYSVPKQIEYQANFDNVYWLNLNENIITDSKIKCNVVDKPYEFKVDRLSPPFNTPDLVIFEDLYYPIFCIIAYQLRKRSIPYIIVPRGSLTKKAQSIKSVKKRLGNALLFKRFIKNALAVQFLTHNEYKESVKFNPRHLVIPNGCEQKKALKLWENRSVKKGIFIGRMNRYVKGLDLLVDAVNELKSELKINRFIIEIYGPDRNNSKKVLQKTIDDNNLNEIIYIKDEVYGEEKEKTLLAADFFILTSRTEGHPMGVLEALSYGLPCFITDGTNMGDEILNYNAGWVANTTTESIVSNLKYLLIDSNDFQVKSQGALLLSKKYSWHEIAKYAHEKYSSLLINT